MLKKTIGYAGIVTIALVSTSAFASWKDDFRVMHNEGGISQHKPMSATDSKSREGVKQEARALRDTSSRMTEASPGPEPATPRAAFSSTRDRSGLAGTQGVGPSDGWRYLGGESGWVFEGR